MDKNSIFLLLLLLLIPVSADAANLYLKDGSIIECILAKQQRGIIYILVNKDTEIELERNEVAINKTFRGKKAIGRYHHQRKSSS